MTKRVLFAGFGGQGVLFAGRVLANAALEKGYEVSWVPSYGPETRGGTSICAVVISDRVIGSPMVTNPDILIAMNAPSYDKYLDAVVVDGTMIMDSSLINRDVNRDDITVIKIDATNLTEEKNLAGLSNMFLLGKLFKELSLFTEQEIEAGVRLSVAAGRENLVVRNLEAIKLGSEYADES